MPAAPTPDRESPSPVIQRFAAGLGPLLPDEERAKLAGYARDIAASTSDHEFRRAWHCGDWAVRLAVGSDGYLARAAGGLREKLSLWELVVTGPQVAGSSGPGQTVELRWVDEAIDIAAKRAAASGWDAVDWAAHLEWMLRLGSPAAG